MTSKLTIVTSVCMSNGYVIICMYVDDMLIVGSDNKIITSTKNVLNSRFDMKYLGLDDVLLGIKIKRTSYGLIFINMSKFNKQN